MDSQKAVGQDAAFQKRPQFALYEPGHYAIAAVLPLQESLQLCSNCTIKDAFFGITGDINRSGFADGEARPGGHEIATLVLILLRETGRRIWVDHYPRSTSCGRQAATYLTARHWI